MIVSYYMMQYKRRRWYSAVHPLARYALYVNVNENLTLPEVKPELQPADSVAHLSEDKTEQTCCHV
jgi:hypothetical protein